MMPISACVLKILASASPLCMTVTVAQQMTHVCSHCHDFHHPWLHIRLALHGCAI